MRAVSSARAVRAGASKKSKVAVTGASGRTGKLIVQQLQSCSDFDPQAIVRTPQGKDSLLKNLSLDEDAVVVADVTTSGELQDAFASCNALIVATSATPKLKWQSIPGFIWKKFFVKEEGAFPEFTYPQMPEEVDWKGQKRQFDAAKAAGIDHVVVVSSMGGTQPDNRLNSFGGGNILVWKRKAEQYLIDLGLKYTILHPGGLKDGAGGEKGLVLGVDDDLLERTPRSIDRADVAALCIQALRIESASNRSVDCINDESLPPPKTTQQFDDLFTGMPRDCDYSLNPAP